MESKQPVWQLHEAKARFSELFRRVRVQAASLVDFFRSAPTGGRPLDLARKRDMTRTIKW